MSQTKQIEQKWQQRWEADNLFEAEPNPQLQKKMVTFPFPYMNGPLHVGHAFSASRVDAYARFKRMQGFNVLFPWAWHWTGQPLLGASQRVARGDEEFLKVLREVDGVPEVELKKFVDPHYMAKYYTNEGRIAAKNIGFSVDWRREFTTITPTFEKYIEWQYKNLKEKGYVTRGTHPVVWCPKDKSPTGDHDRQSGEGVTPEEYILIKYKLDEKTFLPAATFRPETIFGITNMWINPNAIYVEADVDGEKWIISQEAADKLREQERKVTVNRIFKGTELIGKFFENPVTHLKFPILPGWFVDSKTATGVVYSVPAHAPYDYLALRDLQKKTEVLTKFGIDSEMVKAIKPVSIIKVEGFGDSPAVEIVERMDIKDQNDAKADEATKEIYKKEFHSGILKANCGEYAGKSIREAKDILILDFKKMGIADTMYDLAEPVVCRCMTQCIVKILSDQWFLNYSDPQWKELAHKAIAKMTIYPESAKPWFNTVIDWLREWACARTTGFGTPLPWGKGWIIETLSDSTVYMAFYTINAQIKRNNIQPEALKPELFDYVILGKGDKAEAAKATGISVELVDSMRSEFLYWYPFDLRNSAKELVPNHLSFCIFHHAALFPPEHWPKAISVNGMLMVEGEGMHKSKGNFVTMKGAVEKYGADATRCGLLIGAEGMDDPDWRADNVTDLKIKFDSLMGFVGQIIAQALKDDNTQLERWLTSRIQQHIKDVTTALDELKTRTALQIALFEIWNDIKWYIQRKGNTETKALLEAVKDWLKMLAPFAPFMCEELWSQTGERGFISVAKWPVYDPTKVDVDAEEQENLLIDIMADTNNILKAMKIAPTRIVYFTAADWKWQVYLRVVTKIVAGDFKINELMKEFAADTSLKPHIKDISAMVPRIIKVLTRISSERKSNIAKIGEVNEKAILQSTKGFLKRRFNAEIAVYSEIDEQCFDPKHRAAMAMPYQPAIYVE
jgi:leucyl-tRNA synthetase